MCFNRVLAPVLVSQTLDVGVEPPRAIAAIVADGAPVLVSRSPPVVKGYAAINCFFEWVFVVIEVRAQ